MPLGLIINSLRLSAKCTKV